MKWHREGSVIHVELDASDFPNQTVTTPWFPPDGVTVNFDDHGFLINATLDIPV